MHTKWKSESWHIFDFMGCSRLNWTMPYCTGQLFERLTVIDIFEYETFAVVTHREQIQICRKSVEEVAIVIEYFHLVEVLSYDVLVWKVTSTDYFK
jgi:hypothetical protein